MYNSKEEEEEIQQAIKEMFDYIDNEHKYFYTKPPKGIKPLNKFELFELGNLNDDIYLNPIVSSMRLNESKLLNEAEYATYPVYKTIEYVSDALHLQTHMFSIANCHNGAKKIIIKVPLKNGLKDNIDKAMHLCGYYLSNNNFLSNDKRFLELKYEPKYIDEADYIVRNCDYLYHISPSVYKDKILRKGFVPKSVNSEFNYPSRCYFFLGTLTKKEVKEWIPVFKKYNKKYCNTPYSLFTIDVGKIPDNVTFYLDPNLKGGCYTYDNISPSTITSVEDNN